jgi:hypothetical protein
MEALQPRMTVCTTLSSLEARQARVAWTSAFAAGLRFEAPFHAAILDAVLEGRLGSLH